MRNTLYIFLLFAAAFSSCRKDIESENTEIVILVEDDIETNLHGRVVTQNGTSIEGAEIKISANRAFSDTEGYFYIPNLLAPKDGFAMEVNYPSYAKSIRRIIPQEQTNTYEEVILTNEPFTQLYEANVFNLVQDSVGKVSISIPQNSLVDKNNTIYQGAYTAKIIHYSSTDLTTLRTMPGNLEGIDKEGNRVTLGSLGMFYINVESENGDKLFLAENRTATVFMQASFTQGENLPADALIWRLDNDTGIWVEENTINEFFVDGDFQFYSFDITEFEFWNCDIPLENACLSGTFTSELGYPLENRLVQMSFVEDGVNYFCTGGNTNSKGEFEAKVPRNKDITLSIYDRYCNSILYTEDLGQFSENQSNFTLTSEFSSPVSVVTGSILKCEDLPADNATVFLLDIQENVIASTQTNEDGRFSIHNPCFQDLFLIKILDLIDMTTVTSDFYEYDEVETNIGELSICQEADVEFIDVVSTLEFISFSNPSLFIGKDSLILTAESNQGFFSMFGIFDPNGNSQISFLRIGVGNDQLTCSFEFEYTLCSNAVSFSSLNVNDNTQTATGTIDGVLYSGDLSNEDSTIVNDVSISFRAKY